MSARLRAVLARVDAANAADPTTGDTPEGPQPAALLYGRRMSEELARLRPDASEIVQIAVRGQHVERWRLARGDFPAGCAGYLDWRRAQGRAHAVLVAGIMAREGYDAADQARVGTLLRKEGIKRDGEVQLVEDVACIVFIRWYFAAFAEGRAPDDVERIVARTASKMSASGRAFVLETFKLPANLARAFEA